MLKKACCYLCLAVNKRTINIYNTNLHRLYEKLADKKLDDNECWMCFICHTRLQQCHRLQQLAVQTRGLVNGFCQNKIKIEFGVIGSSLDLTLSKTKIVSFAHSTNDVKQEPNVKSRPTNEINRGDVVECTSIGEENEKSSIKFEVPVKIEYHEREEDVASASAFEQGVGNLEMKIEIESEGVEHDEQDTYYEGKVEQAQASRCLKKTLSCEICSKTFTYNSQLTRHAATHLSDKPHTCDICSKKFSDKNNLKKHQRTHTGYKPYNCDICSKKFVQRSNLMSHRRTHTGEKPYSCDVCSKRFSVKPSLEIHMKIHTGDKPFACDLCPRKFIERSTLLNHLKTHTGEKPFMCDICSKKFSMKAALNNHIRMHTGDKPFSCNICLKKFSRTNHLSRHRRNIHKVGKS